MNYNPARWVQNVNGWVCYVYDVGEAREDCTGFFIMSRDLGWWIVDTRSTEEKRIAGPFVYLDSAKAAWRLIFG